MTIILEPLFTVIIFKVLVYLCFKNCKIAKTHFEVKNFFQNSGLNYFNILKSVKFFGFHFKRLKYKKCVSNSNFNSTSSISCAVKTEFEMKRERDWVSEKKEEERRWNSIFLVCEANIAASAVHDWVYCILHWRRSRSSSRWKLNLFSQFSSLFFHSPYFFFNYIKREVRKQLMPLCCKVCFAFFIIITWES